MRSRVRAVRALSRAGLFGAVTLVLPLCATTAWAGGPATGTPPPRASGQEQSAVVGTPVLTSAQRAATARKDAGVDRLLAGRLSVGEHGFARLAASSDGTGDGTGTGPGGGTGSGTDPVVLPAHRSIRAIHQKAQVRTYWCGPATLATLVQADGATLSQTTAARRLGTTRNGTNWYSGAGNYPMERALERYAKGFDYTPANLPYTPTEDDVALFKDRLMTDVVVHKQGIAGNAYEVRGGPHLNGHPNRTIFHWIAVRGYDDHGDTTRYADPVAGSSISWAAPVGRYDEIATDKIVTIFGARGYVW